MPSVARRVAALRHNLLAGGLRRLMGPEEVAHLVYRVGLDVL
jgi:hypothetical protein